MKLLFPLQAFAVVLLLADTAATSSSLRGLQQEEVYESSISLGQVSCSSDLDCPEIHCFMAPCDDNVCVDGFCTLRAPISEEQESPLANDDAVEIVTEVGNTTVVDVVNSTESDGNYTQFDDDDLYGGAEHGDAVGEECGPVSCAVGEECCNRSCGYCVPPGGACTKEFCETPPPKEILPEEEEEEGEAPVQAIDTFWFFLQGDECGCEELCAICQNVLGICIQIGCNSV